MRRPIFVQVPLVAPWIVTLLLLPIPALVRAQIGTSSADSELLLAGTPSVTTAARKKQRLGDAPSAITVITAADIHASGATTLLDVLRYAPGVDVIELNRATPDVSIRGFNSEFANKILVMVDGFPLNDDSYGNVNWYIEPILLSRIARIEIIRGPGSVLYGANAFNGVINIITKSPLEMAADTARTSVRMFTGEQNSQNWELGTTAGHTNDMAISLGLGYNHTGGFGARLAGQPRDSYTTPTVTLDGQKQFRRGKLWIEARNAEAVSDGWDEGNVLDAHWHETLFRLSYIEDQGKNPVSIRAFWRGNYSNSPYPPGQGIGTEDVKTGDVELQQQRNLTPRHSLIFGGNARKVSVSTNYTSPAQIRQDMFGLYVQDDWRLSRAAHLFLGARYDSNSDYGSNVSPRVSFVQHLARQQTLRFSYGTAFRPPSPQELFLYYPYDLSPGMTVTDQGNSSLKPETITSYELGYRKESPHTAFAVNCFVNTIHNQISYLATQFFPPPAPPNLAEVYSYVSTPDAYAKGFEVEKEWRPLPRVRILFNYAYQKVESSLYGDVSLSPKHKINLQVQTKWARHWEGFLGARFVGASIYRDNIANTSSPIAAYAPVDARIGYRFGVSDHPWTISLTAHNLLDDHHLEYVQMQPPGSTASTTPQRRTLYIAIEGKIR